MTVYKVFGFQALEKLCSSVVPSNYSVSAQPTQIGKFSKACSERTPQRDA